MARITIDNVDRPIVINNVEDLVIFTRNDAGQYKEIVSGSEEFMALSMVRLVEKVNELYLGMTFNSHTLESE